MHRPRGSLDRSWRRVSCASSCVRRSHEPAPRDGERSATTVARCQTSREQAARKRARPIHSIREALGSRWVGTSIPPKDERAGIVTTSDGPGGWGEGSGEAKPRKVSTAGLLREAGGSTNSSREQGPVGGRFRSCSLRGAGAAGNVKRVGTPEGAPLAPRRTPWRAKPMNAPALRCREDRWWTS